MRGFRGTKGLREARGSGSRERKKWVERDDIGTKLSDQELPFSPLFPILGGWDGRCRGLRGYQKVRGVKCEGLKGMAGNQSVSEGKGLREMKTHCSFWFVPLIIFALIGWNNDLNFWRKKQLKGTAHITWWQKLNVKALYSQPLPSLPFIPDAHTRILDPPNFACYMVVLWMALNDIIAWLIFLVSPGIFYFFSIHCKAYRRNILFSLPRRYLHLFRSFHQNHPA